MDPEVPVLSVIDLGIVREVRVDDKDHVEIIITPTYSGCPAMDTIRMKIRMQLIQRGWSHHRITTVLSPAWTTDWMSAAGKQKLEAYGIAPPNAKPQVCNMELFESNDAVQCPHCRSFNTECISRFGSTACKALYRCNDCREPFDYFKCH